MCICDRRISAVLAFLGSVSGGRVKILIKIIIIIIINPSLNKLLNTATETLSSCEPRRAYTHMHALPWSTWSELSGESHHVRGVRANFSDQVVAWLGRGSWDGASASSCPQFLRVWCPLVGPASGLSAAWAAPHLQPAVPCGWGPCKWWHFDSNKCIEEFVLFQSGRAYARTNLLKENGSLMCSVW